MSRADLTIRCYLLELICKCSYLICFISC
uniref:Uncharacterized protein n=1 Tax=Anguilla anguilla TaxID=7936 RepID=A0A0E9TM73_ANGAN